MATKKKMYKGVAGEIMSTLSNKKKQAKTIAAIEAAIYGTDWKANGTSHVRRVLFSLENQGVVNVAEMGKNKLGRPHNTLVVWA